MSAVALAYPVRSRHAEIYAKRQAVLNPPVVLAVIRKPEAKPRENVETWLRKSLAARAFIPVSEGWKETAWAQSHYRIVIGGVPCYFAPYVKDWAPWMKRALCRGTLVSGCRANAAQRREAQEFDRQAKLLFPDWEPPK
jgi:hypothetical protein